MSSVTVVQAESGWQQRRFTRWELAAAALLMATFGTFRRRALWELFTAQGFDFEVKAKLCVWALFLVIAVFLHRRILDRSGLLGRMPLLTYVLYWLLASISVIYSVAPSLSAYRALQLALLILLGVAYAEKMEDWPRLGMLFVAFNWVFLLIGITGAVPALDWRLLPEFQEAGFNSDIQPWRFGSPMGHFSQISIVAAMVAVAIAARMRRQTLWRDMFLLAWMVLTVGLTISRTAIMGLVLGLGLVALLRRQTVPFALAAAVGLCLLLSTPGGGKMAVSFLDRGQDTQELESLTGRTSIYEAVLANINKRPVLGYGYRADRAIILDEQVDGSGVSHAHNAVLEATAGLGMGGGALAIGILLTLVIFPAYVAIRERQCGLVPWRRRAVEFAGLYPSVFCFSMLDSSFSLDPNPFIFIFVAVLVDMAAFGKSLDRPLRVALSGRGEIGEVYAGDQG